MQQTLAYLALPGAQSVRAHHFLLDLVRVTAKDGLPV
jgi:hypothetical protein